MTTAELPLFVMSLQAFVQAENIQPNPNYEYWKSGLYCVLDCVYSAQARYASVVLPILQERFPKATGLIDQPDLEFSAFLRDAGKTPSADHFEDCAVNVMHNRQKIAGRLKVQVAWDVCQFFINHDPPLETLADLRKLGDTQLENLVLVELVGQIRGMGPVLGRYLLLMLGLEQHVKPDTLLVRLLSRVGGRTLQSGHQGDMHLIQQVVTEVANAMGTTPARLDNALWFYESTRPRTSSSSG